MAHTQSNPSRAEQTAGGCRMPEHGISRGASDSLLLHTPLSQLLKYLPNSSSQHTTRRKDTKSPTFIEVQLKEEVPYTKLEIKSRYVFFFPGREIASSALSVRRSVRACYSLHLLYVEKKSCYSHSNKAVSALTWFSEHHLQTKPNGSENQELISLSECTQLIKKEIARDCYIMQSSKAWLTASQQTVSRFSK